MNKFSTFAKELRASAVLCASTALLLASCGGDQTRIAEDLQATPQSDIQAVAGDASPIDAVAAAAADDVDTQPDGAAAPANDAPIPLEDADMTSDFMHSNFADSSSSDAAMSTSVPNSDMQAGQAGNSVELATNKPKHSLWVSANKGKDQDNNEGSEAHPFKTIRKASLYAKPGTVVHVARGVYREIVKTKTSGTASARIRYVSDTKWGAKIIGSGTEAAWTNNGNYTDIVGFDISGSGRLGILNYASYAVMSGNHVHHLTVSGGCTGSGGAGIVNANYRGSDSDIIGNVVHDIGIPGKCNGVQGIYHANLRGHVYNNIVYRVSAYGIHLWHAANNVVIANNTVFANGSGRMGGGIVIGAGDAPGGIVLNNTKVINNIVYNNPAASIMEYCYKGQNCIGPNNTVANNLVYGNGRGISLRVGTAKGTITADPRFVNYQANGTGNYRLTSASPAINKGLSPSAPATDIIHAARPRGAALDIGAYENF
jgi:hypothetical protein